MTTRKVRRSQIIGPFGPGAVIDLVGESFTAEDAGNWRGYLTPVNFSRLASRLNVPELRTPPPRGEIPYYRFPQWLFCPQCRRMVRWSFRRERDGSAPGCDVCGGRRQLVPMRFVAVCGNGHLADVDWYRWAHSDPAGREEHHCQVRDKLRFRSRSDAGSGLRSLEVVCDRCGAGRSLENITARHALRQTGMRCTGRQPWQNQSDARDCDEHMVAMQRGASSVYFPKTISAIDIPPDSDWSVVSAPRTRLRENDNFRLLVRQPNHQLRRELLDIIGKETSVPRDEIERALTAELDDQAPRPTQGTVDDIVPEEWEALCTPLCDHDPRDSFITRRAERPPAGANAALAELDAVIEEVVLVDRLREVRVLTSFERHTMRQEVRSNLSTSVDFLPAVEVFGEGFFLRFREDTVAAWEGRSEVQARCAVLAERAERSQARWLPTPTPRYVLMHTLAHLILRHTAYDAGYATSSLRERLYVTQDGKPPAMAGILIYTAAGDTEGTLGGLVRMGEHQRLSRLLSDAVTAARWCSFDPVCGESTGQGPGGLSLAACHACALVPETSCQATNRLLDRRLVIDRDFGFLARLADLLAPAPDGGNW